MSNLTRQFQRSLKGALPSADEFIAKPVRLALAQAAQIVAQGDCGNPACPYRAEVMKARERNKAAVARYRAKRKAKA